MNVLAKKKNEIFLRWERNTAEVLGKVKSLFLFGGELVKVGANLLYLWGRTGRGGGELVGGELVMGRNLRNSCCSINEKTITPSLRDARLIKTE